MPTVQIIGPFAIRVQWREHGVPHAHVVGPEGETVVRIDTGTVLAGAPLRSTRGKEVLAWIKANREMLLVVWSRRD